MTQQEINAAFIRRVERITGMPTRAYAGGEKELDELQEAFDWWIGESSPWVLCDVLRRASEADALRAKLAEVEAQRNETRRYNGEVGIALVAALAEVRALRGALERIAGMSHVSEVGSRGDVARKALATPPGDDAALREVCRRVAVEASKDMSDYIMAQDAGVPRSPLTVDDIVDRICGPKATDASEGGAK